MFLFFPESEIDRTLVITKSGTFLHVVRICDRATNSKDILPCKGEKLEFFSWNRVARRRTNPFNRITRIDRASALLRMSASRAVDNSSAIVGRSSPPSCRLPTLRESVDDLPVKSADASR